ncbi:hypothetical protein BDY21DRAFT_386729 [Lineolata rhizophorae]|uniref:EXPERA domain-containing protein n=1 Tax=Lineolata rhizophorae TaxID=578093 RepID=A0A6A6NVL5_9PEZI|nr:hypothetical protein BDY21DRAFT_386729 [Lineolata rhizophorae]
MVSTRNHPSAFPPPSLSPTKAGSPSKSPGRRTASLSPPPPLNGAVLSTATTRASSSRGVFAHRPRRLVLVWLLLSLPLVTWDFVYVLLRPHTMPGGALHAPVYVPYELYGRVDHVYGWPSWERGDGWTAAQSWGNVAETVGYLAYLGAVGGVRALWGGRGEGGDRGVVSGRRAAWAVVGGLVVSTLTVGKTVLYFLNEACSGFHSIGHNDWLTLTFLWIIPNGAWLIMSFYMMVSFAGEIIDGLVPTGASPRAVKKAQ